MASKLLARKAWQARIPATKYSSLGSWLAVRKLTRFFRKPMISSLEASTWLETRAKRSSGIVFFCSIAITDSRRARSARSALGFPLPALGPFFRVTLPSMLQRQNTFRPVSQVSRSLMAACSADLLSKVCGSPALQILMFSSAWKFTRSIPRPQRRCCSSPLTPEYSCTLDHFQSAALRTKPRRTGFKWMYSTVS